MMQTVATVAGVRAQMSAWRTAGESIALVPTMGNLHAGHYSLVNLAQQHARRVVVSIFVNPTQFGPREDFNSYPRTLEQDCKGLAEHGCDLVFVPTAAEMYPFGTASGVRIEVPVVSEPLEGALRPGHFAGVATVVSKLLQIVRPDVAVFGRKDYQQLLVIQRLVEDMRIPTEIIAAPIEREAHGLAMSSRNQYLTAEQRSEAGLIYQTLRAMREDCRAGKPIAAIEEGALQALRAGGFAPDYATIRCAEDLAEPGERRSGLIALIAARLGTTRLIDNLAFAD